MAKIADTGSVGNVPPDQVGRFASIAIKNIIAQVNGNLTFGENINAKAIDVFFPAASSTLVVVHGLGRVPLMWIAGNIGANANILEYQAADANNIYLQATASCSAKILVI